VERRQTTQLLEHARAGHVAGVQDHVGVFEHL